jgi:hypothetical protein
MSLLIITINIMDCCGAITFSIMTRHNDNWYNSIMKLGIRAFCMMTLFILTISIITIA